MTLTVTHTTPADGTFSATGAAAWDANHALTVSGTSGQVQYNSSGDLAGDAGLTYDATTKALTLGGDVIFSRKAAANLRLGAADAASPIAQTLSVQSVVAGTTNTAGANLTITGSQGTGTGAGGSIVFQVATPGSSGSAQNALVTSLTLDSYSRAIIPIGGTFAGFVYANGNSFGSMLGRNAQTGGNGIFLGAFARLGWTNAAPDDGAADLLLFRDAANTLAQRNGNATPQTYRLYGTYTDASNYERGYFTTDTNGLTLGTEAAGTGVKRPVRVVGPSLASAEAVSAFELSQTWNTTGTPTALKVDVTDTASNGNALLMDLRVGGSSKFSVRKDGRAYGTLFGLDNSNALFFSGNLTFLYGGGGAPFAVSATAAILINNYPLGFSSGTSPDAFITRRGPANLRLGAADAASPIAQTLSVQSVVAGTTNTAGANLTITGSQGTGTGAGGSIVFQVAPAGSSGTAQNALETVWSINSSRQLITPSQGSAALPAVSIGRNNTGLYTTFGGALFAISTEGATRIAFSGGGFAFKADMPVGWSSGDPAVNAIDVFLNRDAANTLAQRNGVNAQTFRLYNTYSDGSNYERISISWASLVGYIKPENGGTGIPRLLVISTGTTIVATLPAAATAGAGARAFVTDATMSMTLGVGSTVAGGGANAVPVYSDGTNWLIG